MLELEVCGLVLGLGVLWCRVRVRVRHFVVEGYR